MATELFRISSDGHGDKIRGIGTEAKQNCGGNARDAANHQFHNIPLDCVTLKLETFRMQT
jgi:hypothetical protein